MAKSKSLKAPKLGMSATVSPARPGDRKPNVPSGEGSIARPGGVSEIKSVANGAGDIARPGGNQAITSKS